MWQHPSGRAFRQGHSVLRSCIAV